MMPPMTRHVVMVNFAQGFAWCDDGTMLPITNWFDENKEATSDWREAETFVAGCGDQWFHGKVADWKTVTIN